MLFNGVVQVTYLSPIKALKQKDDWGWVGPLDDDLFTGSVQGGDHGGPGWVDFEAMI